MTEVAAFIATVGFPIAAAAFLAWLVHRHCVECASARRELTAAVRLLTAEVSSTRYAVDAIDNRVGALLRTFDIPWAAASMPPPSGFLVSK